MKVKKKKLFKAKFVSETPQSKCMYVLWQVFQQLLLIGKLDAVAIAASLFSNWFWHILTSTSSARHKAIQVRHGEVCVEVVSQCCESVY